MTLSTLKTRASLRALTIAAAAALAAPAAMADTPVLVTTGADSGDGSLRAAIAALTETGGQIVVVTDEDIAIDSTLAYEGTAPLAIYGQGQTVSTAANATLLAATNGADLTVDNLSFAGPGGFDIENRGDADGMAGKGIFVDLRDDQTGVVTLVLNNVTVSGVANHGVHVSDCDLADDCGGGGGGAGGGSDASIVVHATGLTIDDAGNGKFDADGLRVDERAGGDIHLIAHDSLFTNVGADGVELDEGQDGDVIVSVVGSRFVTNGAYCHPDLLGGFMPEEDEGEFEEGEMAEADIPGAITGTPDDSCFEREVGLYDDGSVEEYEFAIDVDDGFDVDEAGEGSIIALVIGSEITDNFDEGLDYDEEGPGGIELTLVGTTASGNTDDAYKNSEEDEGSVTGLVVNTSATDNGGVGMVFEEEDGGDVNVTAMGASTSGNDDGELGLEVVQDDDGAGMLSVSDSDIADGVEAEGVEMSEM